MKGLYFEMWEPSSELQLTLPLMRSTYYIFLLALVFIL